MTTFPIPTVSGTGRMGLETAIPELGAFWLWPGYTAEPPDSVDPAASEAGSRNQVRSGSGLGLVGSAG